MVEGRVTTEYKELQSANRWAVVGYGLAASLGVFQIILSVTGAHSRVGLIVSGVIGVLAVVQKTLIQLKYIESRTRVKEATEVGELEWKLLEKVKADGWGSSNGR